MPNVKTDHSVNEIDPYRDSEDEVSANADIAYETVIESISTQILLKRDLAVAFRAASGIERRWREDEAMFEGSLDSGYGRTDMLDYATQTANNKQLTTNS